MVMSPNDADGMANSVDPYQTARSSLIWLCTVCPGISVRKLRIITVVSRYYHLSMNKHMLPKVQSHRHHSFKANKHETNDAPAFFKASSSNIVLNEYHFQALSVSS